MNEQEYLASTDPRALLRWLDPRSTAAHEDPPGRRISDRKLRLFAVACCRQVMKGVECPECEGVVATWAGKQPNPANCWRCHGTGRIGVECQRCQGSGKDPVPYEVSEPPHAYRKHGKCRLCRGTGRTGGLSDPRSVQAVEVAERYADGEASHEELLQACLKCEMSTAGSIENAPAFLHFVPLNPLESILNNAGRRRNWPEGSEITQAALLREVIGNPFRPARLCDGDSRVYPANQEPAWLDISVLRWHGRTVPRLAEAIYAERVWEDMPILGDALEGAGCTDEAVLNHCRGLELCPGCLGECGFQANSTWVPCDVCDGGEMYLQKGLIVGGTIKRRGPHVRGCWLVDLLLGKE